MTDIEAGPPPTISSLKQRKKSNRAHKQMELAAKKQLLRRGTATDETVMTDAQRIEKEKEEKIGKDPSFLTLLQRAFRDEETPNDRILRLKKTMLALNVLQLLFAVSMYVFAGLQVSTDETFVNVFGGVLAFFAALLGLWAAVEKSEFLARLYFVTEVWLLNTLTTYMFLAADQFALQQQVCAPSTGSFSATDTSTRCHDRIEMYRGKLGMAIVTIIFTLINAVASLDLNDAINDYSALRNDDEKLAQGTMNSFKAHFMQRENIRTEDDSRWHLKVYGATQEESGDTSAGNTRRSSAALQPNPTGVVLPLADPEDPEEYAKL